LIIVTQGSNVLVPGAGYTPISLVETPALQTRINGIPALTLIVATFQLTATPFTPDVITILGTSKIMDNGLTLIKKSDLKTSAVGNSVHNIPIGLPNITSK
jgi:hypothetical protein